MPELDVSITLNGDVLRTHVDSGTSLAELVRSSAGLTGTKIACAEGTCGACTVLVDGAPMLSCILLAAQVDGADVRTVEGLVDDGTLSALQRAFVEEDAFQCGFCTPGQLLSATALLAANPAPTRADVRYAMSGNLCRCGAYPKIERAVLRAAGETR
jgi:xanthine dehydrogenase YagT iron-sulfur-binding subunit